MSSKLNKNNTRKYATELVSLMEFAVTGGRFLNQRLNKYRHLVSPNTTRNSDKAHDEEVEKILAAHGLKKLS